MEASRLIEKLRLRMRPMSVADYERVLHTIRLLKYWECNEDAWFMEEKQLRAANKSGEGSDGKLKAGKASGKGGDGKGNGGKRVKEVMETEKAAKHTAVSSARSVAEV